MRRGHTARLLRPLDHEQSAWNMRGAGQNADDFLGPRQVDDSRLQGRSLHLLRCLHVHDGPPCSCGYCQAINARSTDPRRDTRPGSARTRCCAMISVGPVRQQVSVQTIEPAISVPLLRHTVEMSNCCNPFVMELVCETALMREVSNTLICSCVMLRC